jgi:tartrate-resistant acid phosphatase type 5
MIAGNHDYYGNITAELEYAKKSTKWIYPNKYYDMYIPEADVYFIFLDTEIIANTTKTILLEDKEA